MHASEASRRQRSGSGALLWVTLRVPSLRTGRPPSRAAAEARVRATLTHTREPGSVPRLPFKSVGAGNRCFEDGRHAGLTGYVYPPCHECEKELDLASDARAPVREGPT